MNFFVKLHWNVKNKCPPKEQFVKKRERTSKMNWKKTSSFFSAAAAFRFLIFLGSYISSLISNTVGTYDTDKFWFLIKIILYYVLEIQ